MPPTTYSLLVTALHGEHPEERCFKADFPFRKFDLMQVQLNIGFDQLVQLVKALPAKKWELLKAAVENEPASYQSELESLLLNGPVATKKQLETIASNREAINNWRG